MPLLSCATLPAEYQEGTLRRPALFNSCTNLTQLHYHGQQPPDVVPRHSVMVITLDCITTSTHDNKDRCKSRRARAAPASFLPLLKQVFYACQGRASHRRDENAGVGDHSRAAVDQLSLLVPLERLRRRAETRRVEAEVTSELAILPFQIDVKAEGSGSTGACRKPQRPCAPYVAWRTHAFGPSICRPDA